MCIVVVARKIKKHTDHRTCPSSLRHLVVSSFSLFTLNVDEEKPLPGVHLYLELQWLNELSIMLYVQATTEMSKEL